MVDIEKQIKKDPSTGEQIFYLSSSNLEEEINYVNKANICNIELNPYVVEFSETDINFLKQVQNLKSLSIVALKNIDISRINEFSSLKMLYLDENKTQAIDLSGMNLTELNIRYSKSITGIFSLNQLSTLIISRGDKDLFTLESFSLLKKMKSLEIYESNLPANLLFLKENIGLKHLQIGYIRKPFTLNGLEQIVLSQLKITNCKKIDIGELKNLKYLEEFMLVDSVTIPDNNVFSKLEQLKSLIVLGSSFFCDGNLIELQNKLDYLGIDNKRHYNVKYIDPPLLTQDKA
jgi:hypothetical protein